MPDAEHQQIVAEFDRRLGLAPDLDGQLFSQLGKKAAGMSAAAGEGRRAHGNEGAARCDRRE